MTAVTLRSLSSTAFLRTPVSQDLSKMETVAISTVFIASYSSSLTKKRKMRRKLEQHMKLRHRLETQIHPKKWFMLSTENGKDSRRLKNSPLLTFMTLEKPQIVELSA